MALLGRIEATQDEMSRLMKSVVQPRQNHEIFLAAKAGRGTCDPQRHVPMRSLGKSDFAGLASYITDAQSKEHRLGEVRLTNCHASMVGDAITEVLATQHGNTRATSDKTYHLLVSFPPGENPGAEVLHQIEDRVCAALGYDGHQRISSVHNDTDHLHVHIAINKIHPVRHTMHEPFLAYRTMAEVAVKLEDEFGLQQVNHGDRRSLSEGRAGDMEHHAGVESLVGWIKRECLDEIRVHRPGRAAPGTARQRSAASRPRQWLRGRGR